MRRTALTVTAGIAAAGLALAPAAALAAPVIYVYAWDAGALVEYIDPAAGEGEVIPTTDEVYEVAGLDVAEDGTGYAVDYVNESHLYSVDVLTGATADLGALTYAGETVGDCTGLDYTAGVVTIVCDNIVDGVGQSHYLTVDPATLTTTLVVSSEIRAASIATDPADGQLYGFGYNGAIVSVDTGSAVQVGSTPFSATVWGADFASDGSLWGIVDESDVATTVGPWTFHAGLFEAVIGESEEFFENITVYEAAAPIEPAAPQLAATGSDSAPVLFGALAVIALGAGIATAVTVRRRTV